MGSGVMPPQAASLPEPALACAGRPAPPWAVLLPAWLPRHRHLVRSRPAGCMRWAQHRGWLVGHAARGRMCAPRPMACSSCFGAGLQPYCMAVAAAHAHACAVSPAPPIPGLGKRAPAARLQKGDHAASCPGCCIAAGAPRCGAAAWWQAAGKPARLVGPGLLVQPPYPYQGPCTMHLGCTARGAGRSCRASGLIAPRWSGPGCSLAASPVWGRRPLRRALVNSPSAVATAASAMSPAPRQHVRCRPPPSHRARTRPGAACLPLGPPPCPRLPPPLSPRPRSKFISEHGGHTNAYTSNESTNYHFDVNWEHLEPALDRRGGRAPRAAGCRLGWLCWLGLAGFAAGWGLGHMGPALDRWVAGWPCTWGCMLRWEAAGPAAARTRVPSVPTRPPARRSPLPRPRPCLCCPAPAHNPAAGLPSSSSARSSPPTAWSARPRRWTASARAGAALAWGRQAARPRTLCSQASTSARRAQAASGSCAVGSRVPPAPRPLPSTQARQEPELRRLAQAAAVEGHRQPRAPLLAVSVGGAGRGGAGRGRAGRGAGGQGAGSSRRGCHCRCCWGGAVCLAACGAHPPTSLLLPPPFVLHPPHPSPPTGGVAASPPAPTTPSSASPRPPASTRTSGGCDRRLARPHR